MSSGDRSAVVALVVLVIVIISAVGFAFSTPTQDNNTSNPADDYTSHCDHNGNLVYLSEDDVQSSPAIFVLQHACREETP
jgi:hypothetical protein